VCIKRRGKFNFLKTGKKNKTEEEKKIVAQHGGKK